MWCLVCKRENIEEYLLMECRFCGEIMYFLCVEDNIVFCKIVIEINNCWECLKCFKEGEVVSELIIEMLIKIFFVYF